MKACPKTLKFILLLMPVCITLVLGSCKDTCSKKVICAGYNDSLLDAWFPYHNNQVLVFKSNTNLSDTFILHLSDSSTSYTYTSSTALNGCTQTKSFNSTRQDSVNAFAFKISLTSLYGNAAQSGKSVDIDFYDKGFSGTELSDSGFSHYSFYGGLLYLIPQNLTNFSLEGHVYPFAQAFTGDSTDLKNPGVYKIIFAKKYGIIAYETNPGNIRWIKQ